MYPFIQPSITQAVTSTITIAVTAIQAKYDDNILSLCKLIERSLLLKNLFSATLFSNLDVTAKSSFSINILPKVSIKSLNQANLSYFDPHLDKRYSESKIVLVTKDVYYNNIVLFV